MMAALGDVLHMVYAGTGRVRVIPEVECKKICGGVVTTIYDHSRLISR